MTELFVKLGIPSLVGFLLGLVAIAWIDPQTIGGTFLIVMISVAACVVVSAAVGALQKVAYHWLPRRAKGAEVPGAATAVEKSQMPAPLLGSIPADPDQFAQKAAPTQRPAAKSGRQKRPSAQS